MRPPRITLVTSVLLLAAGSASLAPERVLGQDWVGGDGFWSEPSNWHTNNVPGIGSLAFIGTYESTVKDLLIQIDQPVFAEDLRIGNGNQVINRLLPAGDAFPIAISAELQITGENNFNPGPSQPAGLFVYDTAAPVDFSADQLSLGADGELGLRQGAVANIGSSLHISGNARLTGQGVVNVASNFFLPSNDGIIDPRGVLTINQLGDALFDLDGANESGRLFVAGHSFGDGGPLSNDHLTFNGSGLADSFSNNIFLANGRNLTINLAEGWTIDSAGSIFFSGATDPSPATIDGAPLMLQGQVFLQADVTGRSSASFAADTTVGETATVSLDEDALLRFSGETTVEGGQFILQEGASFLQFNGPTTLRGGTFHTFSESTSDGSILFAGENQWDGNVTINGVARQAAPATVIGPTVINADRFDLDGLEELGGFNADWQVNSSLTINAGNIDVGDDENNYNGTITVGGGATSRINMNLTGGQWTMAGTLNLNNNLHFGATRVAGSKIWLKGKLNVEGSDVRVDADAAFGDGSTTSFADFDSSLTMRQHSRVYADAQFVGDGLLRNATTGHMILDDGASTDDVGLRNDGLLGIDAAVGIAAIDRFDNTATGTLAIDLAGYLLGEEFDHLQVAGEAQLDGTLAVDLLTVGLIGDGLFIPEIGDEFLILTSLDGVLGEFANVLPTFADGNVYGWDVLYHPHDVTIRLASVGPAVPEPASLMLFASGMVCTLYSRRR